MHRVSMWLCVAVGVVGCSSGTRQSFGWEPIFVTGQAGALAGVWGSGPDDVHIVGGTESRAEMYHYDGISWAETVLPDLSMLISVYGVSPDSVYAVGLGGSAVHYDGTSWSKLDVPTKADLWGVWGTGDDDLWIVGGAIDDGAPVLMHDDGNGFVAYALTSEQNPFDAHALFKIWGVGDTVFAVGQKGLVLGWDGARWSRIPAGATTDEDFVSLYGTGMDDVVLVGGRSGALIARYDGSEFQSSRPEGVGGLNAAYVDASGIHVGGLPGFTGRFDPDSGEVDEDGFFNHDVHAMWGDGEGAMYAVGGQFAEPYIGNGYVRRD